MVKVAFIVPFDEKLDRSTGPPREISEPMIIRVKTVNAVSA